METLQQTDLSAQVLDYSVDPRLSTEVKAFLKVLNSGGPPVESMSKQDARNVLIGAQASVNVDLSVLSGFSGVFVNYTPSPEAQYPQAINEIYAATKWVAEHGDEINVDGKNLAVVGNSVGGNMTAVTALKAKENNGPKIKLQIMMWPIVDASFDTESYHLFGEQRFLTTSLMKWMYDQYTTDLNERKEIHASPLQATVDQLKGLPPALIQVAENDILRDGGEAYGRKLDEAGVPVTTVRYNGVIHDFGLLNGLAEIPQTRSLFLQAAAELKKYLK